MLSLGPDAGDVRKDVILSTCSVVRADWSEMLKAPASVVRAKSSNSNALMAVNLVLCTRRCAQMPKQSIRLAFCMHG